MKGREYRRLAAELESLVRSSEGPESERLLQESFPLQAPAIDLLLKDVWNCHRSAPGRTLESEAIAEAVRDVELAPRSNRGKTNLKILVTHWCKWSPTVAEHRNDS
jgi:hypothetical protein